jgi:hypothetical protein
MGRKPGTIGPSFKKPTHVQQPLVTASGDFVNTRNARLILLEQSVGIWTLEDARRAFGPFATQEAIGDRSNNTDADRYGFPDSAAGFVTMSLSFYRASGKLVSASITPAGLNREQLVSLLGNDYVEELDANGNRVYKFRDRPITATTDGLGNVTQVLISLEI